MRLRATVLAAVLLLPLVGRSEPLATAPWLVDLGRDYPLSPQASVSDVDAEITLLFMQAAARVDPNLPAAYLWQYDMLAALGRDDVARRALGDYVRLQPDDVGAALRWIALTAATLQTAEERAVFFRTCLKSDKLPRSVLSDLHRRLAEFYWNRGENAPADAEALAALKADPLNQAARQALETVRGVPETPLLRVEHLLSMIAANPASAGLAQRLGQELTLLGLPTQAERWFQHAIAMVALLPPGQPPAELLVDQAEALVDAGHLQAASEAAAKAVQTDANDPRAHLVLQRIALKRGDTAAARTEVEAASRIWTNLLAGSTKGGLDPRLLAEIAWFFTRYNQQPAEAAKLARTALLGDPNSLVAQRALGASLRELKQLPEAQLALKTAAGQDIWAGIELAQVERAAGQADAAAARLRALATQPAGGEQRDLMQQLTREWGVPLATTRPAPADIQKALAEFPYEILNFPSKPQQYLSALMSVPRQEFSATDPWPCTVTLKNTSPFSITLGDQAMVQPELLCSIVARGDRERTSGPSIRILLNRQIRLRPGETMQVVQTLSVGPIRAAMVATPQVMQEIEVTALLNPMRLMGADGRELWAPAPGGFLLPPLHFKRAAFTAVPEAVNAVVTRSKSGKLDERIAATELLAMLVAERQHLDAGRLSYSVRQIDPAPLRAAFLARAEDPDWQMRARVAEAMRWFVLDKPASQVGTKLLSDSVWLVRGLAMRMMADQYRDKFRSVLQRYAGSAAEAWEKRFAGALLDRLKMRAVAASAPAPAPGVIAPGGTSGIAAAANGVTPQAAEPAPPSVPAASTSRPAPTPTTTPMLPSPDKMNLPARKLLNLPD